MDLRDFQARFYDINQAAQKKTTDLLTKSLRSGEYIWPYIINIFSIYRSDSTSDETVYLEDLEATGGDERAPFVVRKKQVCSKFCPFSRSNLLNSLALENKPDSVCWDYLTIRSTARFR